MARKNKNARKRYFIDFRRFAKVIGLTPIQRVKTIKFIEKTLKEV